MRIDGVAALPVALITANEIASQAKIAFTVFGNTNKSEFSLTFQIGKP